MSSNLVLVVRLWVEPDQVEAFEAFECHAAAIIAAYGGEIQRVIRRTTDSDPEAPFEIHIVTFPSRPAFQQYRSSPEVLALAPTRERVIKRTEITFGHDLAPYLSGAPPA